jgi:prephenate dehydratase
MRVAYLGPAGTFSEDALRAAVGGAEIEPMPCATIYEAIIAVESGRAERALVPFENSIEGSVRATLDALAFDTESVLIVGEHDHPISNSLIAARKISLDEIEAVFSHPQASAQCSRFIRAELPQAEVRSASSTAEAARTVVESDAPWAALAGPSAAAIYNAVVLRESVEDEADNVTRFIWLAPAGTVPGGGEGPWKTTLSFSELGADHPGALVDALTEFSSREINLTRIESRPLRQGLGRYMFFCDLEGALEDAQVAAAVEALRTKAENVRVLGSYHPRAAGIPG